MIYLLNKFLSRIYRKEFLNTGQLIQKYKSNTDNEHLEEWVESAFVDDEHKIPPQGPH